MTLAQPGWLIALVLLPLIAAAAILASRAQGKRWGIMAASRLRDALIKAPNPLPGWLSFAFLITSIALIITAISRPQAESGTETETTVGRNLLIALDLSRSMSVSDVQPDRLSQAKLIVYELLDALPSERIGLIGFGGSAYLYAPLTVDHSAVRETVDQVDVTWPTFGGSNLTEAVELGIDTLRKTGQKQNALVVISDGEKHDGSLDEIITEARESGVFILTIGVGTEDGDYVPHATAPGSRMVDRNGSPVISRLEKEVLQTLAIETKGAYATAGSGVDMPTMVKSAIAHLDTFEMEGRERSKMTEFFQWLILPAIVFLVASMICGTRWKLARTTAAIAAIACLAPQDARADLSSNAREALANGRNAEALSLYQQLAARSRITSLRPRYRLGEATAAYRQNDFDHAREAFSKALMSPSPELRDSAHLGMGNTLFQLGWSTFSPSAYSNQSDPPAMDAFDTMVRDHLDQLRNAQEGGSIDGYRKIEDTIIHWADAILHYDSVNGSAGQQESAAHNSALTRAYLDRLAELLEEDHKESENMIPPPQPEPESGDSEEEQEGQDGDKPKEGSEDSEDKQPGEDGPPEDQPAPGGESDEQSDSSQEGQQQPSEEENQDEGEQGKEEKILGETPEERARRILKDNADFEKGPLRPGYREFNQPEKDW